MKTTIALAFSFALLFASAWTSAFSADSNTKNSRTLPVIVQVNAKGAVTDITPAYKLSPRFRKLVFNTLSKMITEPAYRDGEPVSSQFVITLGVIKHEVAQGQSSVSLKYLSSKPLPTGSWYWVHTQSRLALVNSNAQYYKRNTQDTNQLLNDMKNQSELDRNTLGGGSSFSTPSVGTGH